MNRWLATGLLTAVAIVELALYAAFVVVARRSHLLADPVSVDLGLIGVLYVVAVVATLTAGWIRQACWERRRAASLLFSLGLLWLLTAFCLNFFGYVWEWRPGRPFGLWELFRASF